MDKMRKSVYGGRRGSEGARQQQTEEENMKPKPSFLLTEEEKKPAENYWKLERTNAKRNCTRQINNIHDLLTSRADVEDILNRFERLEATFQQLEKAHLQVVAISDTENVDAEMGMLDTYQNQLDDLAVKISKLRKDKRAKPSTSKTTEDLNQTDHEDDDFNDAASVLSGTSDTNSIMNDDKRFYALMSMTYRVANDVTKFDGSNIASYPSWRKAWMSADRKLGLMGKTDGEKLQEMKKVLAGAALDYIGCLTETVDENYQGALQMLDTYYLDVKTTGRQAIEQLLRMPVMDNSVKGMEKAYFLVASIQQTIKGLRLDADQAQMLLFTTLVEQKINANIKRAWAKKIEDRANNKHPLGSTATDEDLMTCIRNEIKLQRQLTPTTPEAKPDESRKRGNKPNETATLPASFQSQETSKPEGQEGKCPICAKNHIPWKCPTLRGKSVNDKIKIIKEKKLCMLCFGDNHIAKDCKRKPCNIDGCGQKHARMLHKKPSSAHSGSSQAPAAAPAPQQAPAGPTATSCHSNSATAEPQFTRTILQTTLAWAITPGGQQALVRVFIDAGSEISLITRKAAQSMGLDGKPTKLSMSVTGGAITTPTSEKNVNFKIRSLDGTFQSDTIFATTAQAITKPLREIRLQPSSYEHLKGIHFAEQYPRPQVEIDILLGMPVAAKLQTGAPIEGRSATDPVAIPTKLGFILAGSYSTTEQDLPPVSAKCSIAELNDKVNEFWHLENLGIREKTSDLTWEEEKASSLMKEYTWYDSTNKEWHTSLLLRENADQLQPNFEAAVAVMKKSETQAIRCGKSQQVNDAFKNLIDNKFCVEVTKNDIGDSSGKTHYLQTHPVYRDDKETTKVRIVMNASARRRGQPSLNDVLYSGPNLLPNITTVLLNFRLKKFAFILDISQMFLRVKIDKGTDLLRFLWRNCDTNSQIQVWKMVVLTFGLCSSPYQAVYILREHAKLFESQFPKARIFIEKLTFMDDVSGSVDERSEAAEIVEQIWALLKLARMEPHKFVASHPEILRNIPQEAHATSTDTKILGVGWNANTDQLTFSFAEEEETDSKIATKRSVLEQLAKLYDPVGMISPFIVKAKIIFQKTWEAGIDWDTPLPDELEKEWSQWKKEIPLINKIQRPRHYFEGMGPIQQIELHCFADASKNAFACCIYIVGFDGKTKQAELAFSKSRMAPLSTKKKGQQLSIVRLELLASLINVRALMHVKEAIEPFATVAATHLYTDSMITLARIRSGHEKLPVWEGNRIKEILNFTSANQWNYVPTDLNPSDLPSRGVAAEELLQSALWWKGPKFITLPKTEWPTEPIATPQKMEKTAEPSRTFATSINEPLLTTILSRFSSWIKTVKLISFLLRFGLPEHKRFRGRQPSLIELRKTELFLIRLTQKQAFAKEYAAMAKDSPIERSTLLQLNPMWDKENSVIRSNSRLANSSLAFDTKFPMILPKNNQLVEKLIQHLHILHGHAGPEYVLSIMRQRFHLQQGRRQIRMVIHRCPVKHCTKPKPISQQMAPLPIERMENPAAFVNVSVDLFGPMFVKSDNSGESDKKVYGAIFTCFHSRAVHLELIKSATSEEFLNALRLFIARRGRPNNILSDNAKNFKAAAKEIRQIYRSINWKSVEADGLKEGIQWSFTTELSPWQNGVVERLVRTVKTPLRIMLGSAKLTFRQLSIILAEVEGIINNRPITTATDDPDDVTPVTPFELIAGRRLDQLPDPNARAHAPLMLQHLWRKRQGVLNSFWKRWRKDYLLKQGIRQKWQKPSSHDLLGKVVLINDDNMSRHQWKLGRITEIIPSRDGLIRNVKVKTASSELRRPVQRLSLLENVL